MTIREATITDIDNMHQIRMSVKENVLNNPLLVTKADYKKFLTEAGKGWVCEVNEHLAGFAIIDTIKKKISGHFL